MGGPTATGWCALMTFGALAASTAAIMGTVVVGLLSR